MTVTVESRPVEEIDAGVIEDARDRQHQHRRYGFAIGLALVVAGVLAFLAFDVNGRSAVAPSRAAAGGPIRPVSPSTFTVFVTPLTVAGSVGLTMVVEDAHGYQGGCCNVYPGKGVPLTWTGGVATQYVAAGQDPNFLLFVAPGVASVRVDGETTIAAHVAPGLPPGDRIVAFRVPQHGSFQQWLRHRPAPVTMTALDSSGHVVPNGHVEISRGPGLHPDLLQTEPTARTGRCAAGSTLSGLTAGTAFEATTIAAPPAGALPGLFFSCFSANYTFKGAHFAVAILLNANTPGHTPAALWGSQPVTGHPGIVEVAPPSGLQAGANQTSPLLARRVDDAWLVAKALPGFHRNPGFAQRIEVLDALHITRLDLGHK